MPQTQQPGQGPQRSGRPGAPRQLRTPQRPPQSRQIHRAPPLQSGPAPQQRPAPRPQSAHTAPPRRPAAPSAPTPVHRAAVPTAPAPVRRAPAPLPDERARRAAARRARQIRRNRRRFATLCVAVGVLAVSGIIMLLLPHKANVTAPENTATAPPATGTAAQVAPLPYAGSSGGGTAAAPAVTWGSVGPVQQVSPYTYTAAPAATVALPESGQVTVDWFSDAAFLGDSVTAGLQDYDVNISGGLVCGYVGAFVEQLAKGTELNNNERGKEVPLNVIAARQPRKIYVMVGTNSLQETGGDEDYLDLYGLLIENLKAAVPQAQIYVQSVLPVRPEAAQKHAGLAPQRLQSINAGLQALCAEKGCYYLAVDSVFADETGALREEYAEADGIHLKANGYKEWIRYLCAHVPYSKQNPYQAGSIWYLDEGLRGLLADIP